MNDRPCPNCNHKEWNYSLGDYKFTYSKKRRATGFLILKQGKFGDFFGCKNFPECRYTEYSKRGMDALRRLRNNRAMSFVFKFGGTGNEYDGS